MYIVLPKELLIELSDKERKHLFKILKTPIIEDYECVNPYGRMTFTGRKKEAKIIYQDNEIWNFLRKKEYNDRQKSELENLKKENEKLSKELNTIKDAFNIVKGINNG